MNVLLAGLLGCNAGEDRELAGEPIADVPIVAVFPPNGAYHLVGTVPIEVVLGAGGDGPTVSVTLDGVASTPPCVVAFEGTVGDCGQLSVDPGTEVTIEVTAGDATATSVSVGREPIAGIGWDLLDGVRFAALGGGGEAASLANTFLGSGHAFAALDRYDGTPGTWTLIAGESKVGDDGYHRIVEPGFVFVLEVTVDADGQLSGQAPTAWLPSYLGGGVVHLLMLDVRVSGRLDGSAFTDVVLTADLPAVTLEELAAPLGLVGTEMLDAIDLDVDRDGDGTNDAATVRLEGSPVPASLLVWNE